MISHFVPSMSPGEVADYVVGRAQTKAFDSVYALWRRRQSEGRKQSDIAQRLGRKESWLSRNLKGPGNWTLRTLAELANALDGDLEIVVKGVEDVQRSLRNYHAYAGYEAPISNLSEGTTGGLVTVSLVGSQTTTGVVA